MTELAENKERTFSFRLPELVPKFQRNTGEGYNQGLLRKIYVSFRSHPKKYQPESGKCVHPGLLKSRMLRTGYENGKEKPLLGCGRREWRNEQQA